MRFKLILFSLLFLPLVAMAGTTGKIAGVVKDAETGEALAGTNIIISARWIEGEQQEMERPTGAAANINGEYFILNLPPGLYDVKCTMMGYKTEIRTKVRVHVDKTTWVNFNITQVVIRGETVTVSAHREDRIEIDQTATKQVYGVDEIIDMVGVNNIQDVIELQADIVDNNVRGGREGESQYLIGDATIVNPLNNSAAFQPMVIGLQEVEVYTSGFSAEYGNAQSGVINMVPKEGGMKWNTRIDVSGTLPHYKHWGGSVYSAARSPWNLLADPNTWLLPAPDAAAGEPLYENLTGMDNFYPEDPSTMTFDDSLKFAEIAYLRYLAFARELGMEYDNRIDYRVDISIGGPLTKATRFFAAARTDISNEDIPTVYPDKGRQIMTNLSHYFTDDDKILVSYTYNRLFNNRGTNHIFELEHDNQIRINTASEYGINWKHVFSPSTFSELKFRILNTNSRDVNNTREPEFLLGKRTQNLWAYPFNATVIRSHYFPNDRGEEKTKTYSMLANISKQATLNNLIKAGFQFYYYDIDVDRETGIEDSTTVRFTRFSGFPFEGAFYVQDKMEFQGMIANIGLRYDFYNFNTDYFSDIYSPTRNPEFVDDESIPYQDRPSYLDESKALRDQTKTFTNVEPRIGLAFPIAANSVVHMNYGTFMQRPNFEQILYNYIDKNGIIQRMGNPRLEPEKTIAYDVGIVQGLPFNSSLEVSVYFKDVKNLVEGAYYEDAKGNLYETFINRDYANIKGFHVNLEKRSGNLSMILRYNFQVAKGKAASPFDAPLKFIENPDESELAVELPDPDDIFMDYDRTHRLVSSLTYNTSRKAGFKIFGFRPFANLSLNLRYTFMNGRPYTYDTSGKGLKYNQRTPDEHDMRLRISKNFKLSNIRMSAYIEAFNVLNQKIWGYGLFSRDNNYARTRYHEIGKDAALINEEYAPFIIHNDRTEFRNSPRYFRLGLQLNL